MKAVDQGTQALLDNAKKRLASREGLFSKGYLPSLDILDLQREVIQGEREIAQNKASAAQLKSDQIKLGDQINQLVAENRKTLLDNLLEVRTNLFDFRKQLIQAAEVNRMMSITSPVDGVIQQLNISTVGGVVQPAQELMIIVPEEGNLQAEVSILNKDVGFIQPG
jgi:multidrug resistance efflux pump